MNQPNARRFAESHQYQSQYNESKPSRLCTRANSRNACQTWRSECARLHGNGTARWNASMNQLSARQACGGAPRTGNRATRTTTTGSCQALAQQCARLHADSHRTMERLYETSLAPASCGGAPRTGNRARARPPPAAARFGATSAHAFTAEHRTMERLYDPAWRPPGLWRCTQNRQSCHAHDHHRQLQGLAQSVCARLHGNRTARWNACMNQPGAAKPAAVHPERAIVPRAQPPPAAAKSGAISAHVFTAEGTAQWNACMNQPGARRDCGRRVRYGNRPSRDVELRGAESVRSGNGRSASATMAPVRPQYRTCMRQSEALVACGDQTPG
jgi:hypothetical protein